MSKNRGVFKPQRNKGASESRKIRRAGIEKYNFSDGTIIKRPFSNRANPKRKKTHKFVNPTMIVDRNGKSVAIPLTRTVSYKRRVFPDQNGCFPIGILPDQIAMSMSPIKDKIIYHIPDTKEVAVKSYRVNLHVKQN